MHYKQLLPLLFGTKNLLPRKEMFSKQRVVFHWFGLKEKTIINCFMKAGFTHLKSSENDGDDETLIVIQG